MKSLAVLVVVVGLAVGCDSIWFRGADRKVDFEALNNYLRAKLGDNEDKETNVALINADRDGFNIEDQMGIKLAAGVASKLAEVTNKSECDDQLLSVLHMASDGGMNLYEELAPEKRVERLLRPQLLIAMDSCAKYIGETFPVHLKARDADLRTMSNFISPDEQAQLADHYDWPGSDFLARVLRELSRTDPRNKKDAWTYGQTNKLRMFEEREIFNYVYKKYLADPCDQLRYSLGKFFNAALAIVKMRGHQGDFAGHQFDKFRQTARTNYLCKRIVDQAGNFGATSSIYLSREGW